jgi:hypothetical protein
MIAAVRELDSDRVLVSDESAVQLLVADFRSGGVSLVGRRGQGPGEYRQAGRVWPTHGDTTLHKEPYAPRLLVLAGSEVVGTRGARDSVVHALGLTPILGVDTLGHAVVAVWNRDARGRAKPSDSLHLVRVHWRTGMADTITRVESDQGWSDASGIEGGAAAVPGGGGESAGGRKNFVVSLLAPDQVAVLPSGWIAIARAEPYRVDWCSPAGVCTAGPVLQSQRPRLTDSYKQLYLRRAAMTFGWPPTERIDATSGWPKTLPPFVAPPARVDASAILAAPGDRVLVQRTDNAGSLSLRYDVVDRVNGIVGWIEVPPTERVVGFGAHHIYLSRTGADGSQQLLRHPWAS